MRGGIGFGVLHHYRADCGIQIVGVVVAGELAIGVEASSGARGGDDGDGRSLLLFHTGATGKSGLAAAVGAEAGQIDDAGAAAAKVDARDNRSAAAAGARAAAA